jgi:UDPglucose--hexose-1-phosphate uridylyltransferase
MSHAPWAALHAGGAYTTLARAIEETGGRGQVVNIVPTLLEQLVAYHEGRVDDPVLDAIVTPAAELIDAQRELLVEWGFHVNPRQMARYPRLAELANRRPDPISASRLAGRFGPGDLRDLQVLFVLAHAGEQVWTDDRLLPLHDRWGNFGADDHLAVVSWLCAQPGELVERWRRIAAMPGVEFATSPYAHPIMPLLADTAVVEASWAPHPPPSVPPFRHADDAAWQLATGLDFMRQNGFDPRGCWPPEGSVSEEVVEIYHSAGVSWLVTDEGILERSLDRPLREGQQTLPELYQPWRLASGGPVLFFRDRQISDAIGFQYGRWSDEGRAADELVRELEGVGNHLPADACIVIALDGENPWLHYPEGGGRFLRELMDRLHHCGPALVPSTLGEVCGATEAKRLDRLHPGSWINSTFATWIGHPEKTRAWEVLAEVRSAIENTGNARPPSLLHAESSDWFWWLGDDNPTDLAPLYDRIFRRHLEDACVQAGIDAPVNLDQRLKSERNESVSELRFCAIKHRWTIIAPERKQRPNEFLRSNSAKGPTQAIDPFAPGNESETPPEIFTVPSLDGGAGWQVRVFANKFPVLRVEGEVRREAVGLNDTVSGVGAHEVIVETPDSDRELADLSVDEIMPILDTYRARLVDLRHDRRLRYVLIFKNKGEEAGSSVPHAHSQLIATPIIPTLVAQELNVAREHYGRCERCLFCDLIRQELRLQERICVETDRYIALAPFAASYPFESWIFPKQHHHDFALSSDDELRGLAVILREFLRRMRTVLDDPPYNLVLHTAPNPHPRPGQPDFWSTIEHDYHWHLEAVPRITRAAGFEWGSGYTINSTSPEEAASLLKEAKSDAGQTE